MKLRFYLIDGEITKFTGTSDEWDAIQYETEIFEIDEEDPIIAAKKATKFFNDNNIEGEIIARTPHKNPNYNNSNIDFT